MRMGHDQYQTENFFESFNVHQYASLKINEGDRSTSNVQNLGNLDHSNFLELRGRKF